MSDLPGNAPDGYMGPTSYAAIFREDGEGKQQFQTLTRATPDDDLALRARSRGNQCNLEDPAHIEQGTAVLASY